MQNCYQEIVHWLIPLIDIRQSENNWLVYKFDTDLDFMTYFREWIIDNTKLIAW